MSATVEAAAAIPVPARRVAILIVSYEQETLLSDCLTSLLAAWPSALDVRILVVDNASRRVDLAALQSRFPSIAFERLPENLGFAGGNNAGWRRLQETTPELDYLVLLNPDTLVEPGWLEPLIDHLEAHPEAAAAQPLLLLHPETRLINTTGNRCHFLGFGLMSDFRRNRATAPRAPVAIDSPSGAAVALRAEVLRTCGLFDERYFLYLEDTELGWKLRSLGHQVHLAPQALVYHRFQFQAPYRNYGLLERNRLWLVFAYYRWPTLLLLLPALLLMEAGQWLFACRNGLLQQRLWAYREVLSPANVRSAWVHRRRTQQCRNVTDRELTRNCVATFDAALLPGFLVQRVANPVFAAYWRLVRLVLWW